MDEGSRVAKSEKKTSVKMIDPSDCPGVVYYLPTPKSPHGVDVDPTGEYIVAGGKLATVIPVHSFTKLQKAIADKAFENDDRRHPGAQVRRGDGRRSAEAWPRPAAHGVRRQGLRLHVDVHLVRSREVEARHVGSRRPHSDLLLDRPPHDSRRRQQEAVGQVPRGDEQDHEGSLSARPVPRWRSRRS